MPRKALRSPRAARSSPSRAHTTQGRMRHNLAPRRRPYHVRSDMPKVADTRDRVRASRRVRRQKSPGSPSCRCCSRSGLFVGGSGTSLLLLTATPSESGSGGVDGRATIGCSMRTQRLKISAPQRSHARGELSFRGARVTPQAPSCVYAQRIGQAWHAKEGERERESESHTPCHPLSAPSRAMRGTVR